MVFIGALALVAVQGGAARARALRRPQRLTDRQELVDQRNATTQVFLEPDGSSTAEIHSQPINYKDASGAWQPIDPTLVASTTPGFGWQNAAAGFTLQFAASPLSPQLVTVSAGGATLGFGAAGANPLALPVASGDQITYADLFPDTNLTFESTSSGLKESLVLEKAPTAGVSYRFPLSH